jgi:hypothetical protein
MIRRHLPSLGLGQSKRTIGCRPPRSHKAALDLTFIDPGGFDSKFETCISEQSLPRRA